MEPYDSMQFHAWKRHEIIVWNHFVPFMESHERLMNLDPGIHETSFFRFEELVIFHFFRGNSGNKNIISAGKTGELLGVIFFWKMTLEKLRKFELFNFWPLTRQQKPNEI